MKSVLLFSLLLIVAIPLAFGEILSPLQQLNEGTDPLEIQCREGKVLALRTNGGTACINESSAIKLNWNIIPITSDLSSLYDTPSQGVITTDAPYDSEGHEFGLFSAELATQRAPSRDKINQGLYDKIISFDKDGTIHQTPSMVQSDAPSSLAGSSTTPIIHPPINPSRTFVISQWIPTYIPDGQELKVINWTPPLVVRTTTSEKLSFAYGPTNQTLTEDSLMGTVHDIQGIAIGGEYWITPMSEVRLQSFHDFVLAEPSKYDQTTILGHFTLITNNQDNNTMNHVLIDTEDWRFGASSYRYSTDTLIQILESIVPLQ